MRELIDCHIHTERCGHATGTVDDYVRAAVVAVLSGIVITEHLALPEELDPHRHLSMPACDLENYLVEVDLAAQRYPDITIVTGHRGRLPARPRARDRSRRFSDARRRSDGARFVLGSVHFIGDWAFDDPTTSPSGTPATSTTSGREYFELWCEAARSGLFDCMAHPDLPKKFGHRPTFDTSRPLRRGGGGGGRRRAFSSRSRPRACASRSAELYPGPDLLDGLRAGRRRCHRGLGRARARRGRLLDRDCLRCRRSRRLHGSAVP